MLAPLRQQIHQQIQQIQPALVGLFCLPLTSAMRQMLTHHFHGVNTMHMNYQAFIALIDLAAFAAFAIYVAIHVVRHLNK